MNFIVHKGDTKDPDADRSYIPAKSHAIWLKSGDATVYAQRGAVGDLRRDPLQPHGRRLRPVGACTCGPVSPAPVDWDSPFLPTGADAFGLVFKVPLTAGATELAYILHKGDTKDLPDDQFLDLNEKGYEVWILQSTPSYLLPMQ